jgi:uncharacterized protein YbaR (Trm112 family)
VACPNCGARLVSVSTQPPIRLICAQCGRPLPVKPPLPLYLWLKLNARRWIVLLVVLVLPLVMLSLTPQERPAADRLERPRLGRVMTGRGLQGSQRRTTRSTGLGERPSHR